MINASISDKFLQPFENAISQYLNDRETGMVSGEEISIPITIPIVIEEKTEQVRCTIILFLSCREGASREYDLMQQGNTLFSFRMGGYIAVVICNK